MVSVPPSTIVARAARTWSLIRAASGRSAMPAVANVPLASSSRDASPSPAWRRKLASRCGPCGVSTDSGMELDALEREGDMADPHHHPVDLAHGGHAQLGRQGRRIDRERVVARGHERRRHAIEQPLAVVGDLGSLAVDERRGAHDRGTEGLGHRLHPQAHAEQRDPPVGGDLDGGHADAGVVRVARPRRDDDAAQVGGRIVGQRLEIGSIDRVVAHDAHVRAGRLQRLHEVEGEAVVVVDDEDHALPPVVRVAAPAASA